MKFVNPPIKAAIATLLFMSAAIYPLLAPAIELGDGLSLRGFYTLDLSYSDSDGAVIPTRYDPVLLDEGDSSTDASLIGAQLDYAFSDNLSFTLQAIATGQSQDEYEPSVEWAYFSYDFGHDLHLRGGKLTVPLLQGTELRYVGFSRLWIRPLVPNNGAGGFDDYEAVELIKGSSLGDYNLTFQAGLGRADHHQDFIDNNHVVLLSGKIEREGSWVNLALMQADFDADTQTGKDIKDGAIATLASIEAEVLFDNAVINAGYAISDAEVNPDQELIYLSLGYRFPRATPYLLVQQREMVFDASQVLPIGVTTPPPPSVPDGRQETRSTGLGVRVNLGETYAIKVQLDHWQLSDESQAGPPIDRDGNLFSFALEGVF